MEKSKYILETKIPEYANVLQKIDATINNVDEDVETKQVIIPNDLDSVTPYDYTGITELFKPIKNYYKYEKVYNKSYNIFEMTPVSMCVLANQIIMINFKFNIKLPDSTKSYKAEIYFNNDVVKTYEIGPLQTETNFCLEYFSQIYNLEPCNIMYAKIREYENNVEYYSTVYVENLCFELWGVNAYVLHLEKKFNVTCFNNTYYITKSTGEKTYLLEKSVDEITEIDENEFVEQTDAYGLSAQITFTSKQQGGEFVFDKKILTSMGPNGEIKIFNLTDNIVVIDDILGSNFRVAECLPHKNSNEYVLEFNGVNSMWANFSSESVYLRFSSALNFATSNRITMLLQPGWFLPVLSPNGNINNYVKSIYIYAGQPLIGTSLCDLSTGLNSLCGVINGTPSTAYYLEESMEKIEVFSNVFGKCVRSVAHKNNSNIWEVLERKVIGNYDYYFEGANNDYFVVVNNQLKYYKK